ARPADRTIRSAGSSRYTASTAGARENVRTSAGPPAIATTFTAPGATSATTLVPQVRHRISRHEHSALHPDAFRPLKFRMSNVDPQRPIARRVRPDKHPVRIALILRDVLLQPLNHFRDIPSAVVPVLPGMPLHRDADHVVLHSPSADVVVKRVGFTIL